MQSFGNMNFFFPIRFIMLNQGDRELQEQDWRDFGEKIFSALPDFERLLSKEMRDLLQQIRTSCKMVVLCL